MTKKVTPSFSFVSFSQPSSNIMSESQDQPRELPPPYESSSTPQIGDHCTNDSPLGSLFRLWNHIGDVYADLH